MFYPELKRKSARQAVTNVFLGINRAQEIADGEFSEAMNLSTREYPMLCPRKPRGIGAETEDTQRGMMEKNGKLAVIVGSRIEYGGQTVQGITVSEAEAMQPKFMVGMGAYVVVFPDKVYFNTVDLSDCGSLEASYESAGDVTYTMCRLDGSDYEHVVESRTEPEDPYNGMYWIDTGQTPHALLEYSSLTGAWTQIPTVYIRIGAEGIGAAFAEGDTVTISGAAADPYEPDGSKRTAGPAAHLLIEDADAAAVEALTVTHPPEQSGEGEPDAYNVRRFIGNTSCALHISPTPQADSGETLTADWEQAAGTLYGWIWDVLAGTLKKTHARIAAYDHDTDAQTISGRPWLSSMDVYAEGTEPTEGAEVVYELEEPVEYTLTPETAATVRGLNHIWADAGQVSAEYAFYDPWAESAAEQVTALNGSQYIYGRGDDWITVVGTLDETAAQSAGTLKAARKCPDMEYVIEDSNRLWGCHYGPGDDGQMLNEIYACKLGDFKNWRVYQGISTDSYAVSVGSDGPFTGAVSFGGMPMFFKAGCVHKIYGALPKNYQVMTTKLYGVQPGSGKSLAIVDGTLLYLSQYGVMAYDGSLPVNISQALGDSRLSEGAAGALGSRYYLSAMQDNALHMYVYDSRLGIWQEEDAEPAIDFAEMGGDLYILTGHRIDTVLGSAGTPESKVYWSAETGLQGWETDRRSRRSGHAADHKYVTRYNIRAVMGADTKITCSVQYDGKGRFWPKMELTNLRHDASTRLMPVYPKRCDHLKMRIEGEGEIKIHSIIRLITNGGDGKRG